MAAALEFIANPMVMGPLLAGAFGAAQSSTKGIDDACDGLNNANKEFAETKKKWNSALSALGSESEQFTQLNHEYAEKYGNYKDALNTAVQINKEKFLETNIFIAIFLVTLVLTLLIKYLNLFEQIWSIF